MNGIAPIKTRLMATSPLFDTDTRPEIYRVGLTFAELDSHTNWPDLRDLLIRKGIPLYKLVEGANYATLQVKDGVVLEFS